MFKQISTDRQIKLRRYGKKYKSYMEANRVKNQNNAGFWSKCKEIT
jgi:hypothetical protein